MNPTDEVLFKVCAGCDGPILSEYVQFDLPAEMTPAQVEFYIYGKSQFCDTCIFTMENIA